MKHDRSTDHRAALGDERRRSGRGNAEGEVGLEETLNTTIQTNLNEEFHFAIVYEQDAAVVPGLPEFGTTNKLTYYRNGEVAGELNTAIPLSELNDVNNWLGRSNWTGDANFNGTYDEFRIYDRALSHDEVLGNIGAGPEIVNIPEPEAFGLALLALLGVCQIVRRR